MRVDRGFPSVNAEGRIDIDSVNKLTLLQLKQWTAACLAGEDPGAGGTHTDLPHTFLADVYHELAPFAREAFHDCLLAHLEQLAAGKEQWLSDSGDELLLLLVEVFGDSFRPGAPVDLLRYILEEERLRRHHFRAAQSLVGLRYRAAPKFWIDLFEKRGDEYALIVFGGLTLSDISYAFGWLNALRGNLIAPIVIATLPSLVDFHGTGVLSSLVADLYRRLAEPSRVQLRPLLQRLGFLAPRPSTAKEWQALIEQNLAGASFGLIDEELMSQIAIDPTSAGAGILIAEALVNVIREAQGWPLGEPEGFSRVAVLAPRYSSSALFLGLVELIEVTVAAQRAPAIEIAEIVTALDIMYRQASDRRAFLYDVGAPQMGGHLGMEAVRVAYLRALRASLIAGFSESVWRQIVSIGKPSEIAALALEQLRGGDEMVVAIISMLQAWSLERQVELVMAIVDLARHSPIELVGEAFKGLQKITFSYVERQDVSRVVQKELTGGIFQIIDRIDALEGDFRQLVEEVGGAANA